ncbi:hypothetical protein HMPREF6745_3060 [Prevotella sp. oral taxon 472 str. F0295]|nr:hypothetical protein HMPREF6745_3060 [Prevotella sp. oral taxon 472 str. F0295]
MASCGHALRQTNSCVWLTNHFFVTYTRRFWAVCMLSSLYVF